MNLEMEQAEKGGAMKRFLDIHIYMTSLQESISSAVLQLALDAIYTKVIYVHGPSM